MADYTASVRGLENRIGVRKHPRKNPRAMQAGGREEMSSKDGGVKGLAQPWRLPLRAHQTTGHRQGKKTSSSLGDVLIEM